MCLIPLLTVFINELGYFLLIFSLKLFSLTSGEISWRILFLTASASIPTGAKLAFASLISSAKRGLEKRRHWENTNPTITET